MDVQEFCRRRYGVGFPDAILRAVKPQDYELEAVGMKEPTEENALRVGALRKLMGMA